MDSKIEIARRIGRFYDEISPQIIDGSLQYYLSGSLANMILGSAEEITELKLDEDNNIIGERNTRIITPEQRVKIQTFSRTLGGDVDVVNVNGDLFSGAPKENRPHQVNVEEHVPGAYDVMGWPKSTGGTMYIDCLEQEREIRTHPVVKVKTKEGDILVTAPPELLAHKISETMFFCSELNSGKNTEHTKKSYEKDIRDVATMFYGFYELYGEEFLERVYKTLMEKDNSQFYTKELKVQEFDETVLFKKIKEDCMAVLMKIGDTKASFAIETFLDQLLSKRRKFIEEQLGMAK